MSNHQTASLDFADRPAARCQTTRQAPEAVWPRRLSDLLAGLEDENTYEFAAWGIGTHPGAALIGEHPSFEGERIYGWTHVSTGSSATLPGGTVQAKIHLDGIIGQPSIWLDDEKDRRRRQVRRVVGLSRS